MDIEDYVVIQGATLSPKGFKVTARTEGKSLNEISEMKTNSVGRKEVGEASVLEANIQSRVLGGGRRRLEEMSAVSVSSVDIDTMSPSPAPTARPAPPRRAAPPRPPPPAIGKRFPPTAAALPLNDGRRTPLTPFWGPSNDSL